MVPEVRAPSGRLMSCTQGISKNLTARRAMCSNSPMIGFVDRIPTLEPVPVVRLDRAASRFILDNHGNRESSSPRYFLIADDGTLLTVVYEYWMAWGAAELDPTITIYNPRSRKAYRLRQGKPRQGFLPVRFLFHQQEFDAKDRRGQVFTEFGDNTWRE